MEAIVLAGGLGTRLKQYLDADLPKPMAPVAGRPFLEYLLNYIAAQGVQKVVLAVSHNWSMIADVIGNTFGGMKVCYSVEETPLGTGGAIKKALKNTCKADVVILNGDTFATVNLSGMLKTHYEKERPITLLAHNTENAERFGLLSVDTLGTVVGFSEKKGSGRSLINAGVYMINNTLFEPFDLPDKFSFEAFLEKEILRLRPQVFFSQGYFIDIGVPEDYKRANKDFPLEIRLEV